MAHAVSNLPSFLLVSFMNETYCRYPISVVDNTRIAVWSLPGGIPPRNRPIHLSQFAKYLSVVVKTVAAGRDIRHSSGGCAADDGMSQPLAISFNPK